MKFEHIGFIGLGLIGGSISKAIKQKYPQTTIIGHASHASTLEQAYNAGVISNNKDADNKNKIWKMSQNLLYIVIMFSKIRV